MKRWQAIAMCIIYFAFCLAGIQHHELWLDEAHHFLLGRDSHSFGELMYNSRYEGHPLLWNILVYVIIHLFENIFYIQLFHISVSTLCVYLIFKHAPFPFVVKLLVVFGYFMLYEYSTISRHYSLALLLLLFFLVEYSAEKKRLILLSLFLALLCNVHVFSAIMSFGLLILLYNDWKSSSASVKVMSLFVFVCGVSICVMHIIPPPDHFLHAYNQEALFSIKRFTKMVWVPLKGIFPLANFSKVNYWNSNVFIETNRYIALLLSVIAFIAPTIIFLKNRKVLFLFYFSCIGIMVFFYATPLMLTTRNCGYMSILLFIAYWLHNISSALNVPKEYFFSGSFIKWTSFSFVTTVLVIQFIAGVIAYSFDMTRNFSNSKDVATYINSLNTNSSKIMLSHQSSGPALVVYMHKPLFYLESEENGSFCKWDNHPFINSDSLLLCKINRQLVISRQAILILNEERKLNDLLLSNNRLKIIRSFDPVKLKQFTGATVSSENYFIYSVQ